MVSIAVTGGIACGKSHLANYLKSFGIPVCEADNLAHETFLLGTKVYELVVNEFGIGVLDGSSAIDRKKLAKIVFGNPERLQVLNDFVHPVVSAEIKKWMDFQKASGTRIAVVVIPLLFEVGMAEGWDAIISVGCSPVVQQKRLIERGLSERQCRLRVDAQMPIEDKMDRSDYVIWNNEDETSFHTKIDDVLKTIQEIEYGGK